MKIRTVVRNTLAVAAATIAATLLIAAKNDDFRLGRNMEILFNMFREINMFYVDPVDPDALLADAAEGMTSQLDPYTEYLPEEEMEDFEVLTTGKYAGIGAIIRQKGDWVVIAQPYRGFPADKAGLQVGDRIVEIAGKDARGMTTQDVSGLLRGDPGTSIKLTVEKFFTGQTVPLSIRRERIVISGISYYGFFEDGIGYIRHLDFTEDCAADMRKALNELRKEGELRGLVIDLRDNGGGILQEAVKILSLFVPKGTEVVSMRGRVKEMDAVFKTESEPVEPSLPIAVLVNSQSASAAEIVAGALQDLDRAVLIGQRTFGKGLVQTPRPLGYNSYLKITTAKYYIPSGRCIQAIDYAHRNEDGSVSSVPDSLVKEFSTAAGRKVYDGGGIVPEVKTAPRYFSRFVAIIYARGYIEDFVDQYTLAHRDMQTPLRTYSPGDDLYAAFTAFMADKSVDFESETHAALDELKKKAARERYLDKIKGQIESIEKLLPDDKRENLELYRDEIRSLIADEIIMRRYYSQGVAEYNMAGDGDVAAAAAMLKDQPRYRSLLSAPR